MAGNNRADLHARAPGARDPGARDPARFSLWPADDDDPSTRDNADLVRQPRRLRRLKALFPWIFALARSPLSRTTAVVEAVNLDLPFSEEDNRRDRSENDEKAEEEEPVRDRDKTVPCSCP